MFHFFRKSRPVTPAPIVNDMPAHRGFIARVTLVNGKSHEKRFDLLSDAQTYVAWANSIARQASAVMGYARPGKRRATIRNLETGRFAPYLWTVSRGDIARAGYMVAP